MDTKKFCNLGEEELKALVKSLVNSHRYEHSLNVAKRAEHLAKKYGADPEKAYFAGLVHDICKGMSGEEQLALMAQGGIVPDEDMLKSPAVWHSAAGSVYIQKQLAVADLDIINAVRYHTTGRAGMSLLEKVIYIADLTSDDRSYPDAAYVRRLGEISLEQCMAFSCRWIENDVKSRGLPPGKDTEALVKEYENIKITYTKDDFEKGSYTMESKELALKIAKILDNKKAKDIRVLKICDVSSIGDYFVICSASNKSHVQSLSDEVDFTLGHEYGIKPKRVEGYSSASWILMDYSDVIVHIFHDETREFYSLERLWSDAKIEELDFDEEK